MKYVFQCRQRQEGGKQRLKEEKRGQMNAENRLEMGDEVMHFLGCRAKVNYFTVQMHQFDVSNFIILAQTLQPPSEFV